jgi:tetratricopeptide (TPR) repeat protein
MKQSRFKRNPPVTTIDPTAKKTALEFVRIAQLTKEGKGEEAWGAANDLYSQYPNDPTANFIIALILEENGQKADALPYAELIVKLVPDNARYLVFLGKLYVDLNMIEYALAVLHKAFAIDKSIYQAPWALAAYHLKSGQGNRAWPYFNLAIESAPEAAKADICFDRAECFKALGRVEEAEEGYRQVADVPRFRIRALTESALLKKNDGTSDHSKKIQEELAKPGLSDKDKSRLLLCLGRLYENSRDYDNAFQKFVESRSFLTSTFDSSGFISHIDQILKMFTQNALDQFENYGDPSNKPIFVVGMPRSGTTMTEQIIGSHSLAEGVGELDRMTRMEAWFSRSRGLQEILDTMKMMGPKEWKNVPLQYLRLINAFAPDAQRVVDKMPHNFMNLGFIHLCFPNAKIIHCRRNPLDNFVSAFQNSMSASHGYAYDQVAYGEYYLNYLRLMDHWKSVLPTSIYETHYEELTANPEKEIRKILDFLGLPWEEACLRFNERESTVRTFSRLQVRDAINTKSVARWRNYEQQLAPIVRVFENAGIRF